MKSIPSTQGSGGRGGRQVPLVQGQDHADSFLFELSEVRGADIAATVAFVPRTPRAVGHLKLIVKEEREGWVLQGEKQKLGFRELSGVFTGKHSHKNSYTRTTHKHTVCFQSEGHACGNGKSRNEGSLPDFLSALFPP